MLAGVMPEAVFSCAAVTSVPPLQFEIAPDREYNGISVSVSWSTCRAWTPVLVVVNRPSRSTNSGLAIVLELVRSIANSGLPESTSERLPWRSSKSCTLAGFPLSTTIAPPTPAEPRIG